MTAAAYPHPLQDNGADLTGAIERSDLLDIARSMTSGGGGAGGASGAS